MRQRIFLLACAALCVLQAALADELEVPVPRDERVVGLDLGGFYSCYVINGHYTTGWGHYVETVPGTQLLHGIGSWGVTPITPESCEDFFRRCAEIGLRHLRWEIGWCSGAYRTDMSQPYRLQPQTEELLLAGFRAGKKHGVKTMILRNRPVNTGGGWHGCGDEEN